MLVAGRQNHLVFRVFVLHGGQMRNKTTVSAFGMDEEGSPRGIADPQDRLDSQRSSH